jgi:hypothetical protein
MGFDLFSLVSFVVFGGDVVVYVFVFFKSFSSFSSVRRCQGPDSAHLGA